MLKIAVLVSGNGSNLQTIIDRINDGYLNCSIEYVIGDRKGIYALKRAEENGIKTLCFDRKENSSKEISEKIMRTLQGEVDLVVLAGFLTILKGELLKRFKGHIINIHPSLIPKHCGRGMYGDLVHKSVLRDGDKISGCTVHYVDEGTDTGPIIAQMKVDVEENESLDRLREKVRSCEHRLLVDVIKNISDGGII